MDMTLLKEIIISYNQTAHERSLQDGSYKGEEGVLRINPDVAKSLGLKVAAEERYHQAMELSVLAETLLSKAVAALSTRQDEAFPGGRLETIAEYALSHKRTREMATERFMDYRRHLSPQNDERLVDRICIAVLERILKRSLEESDYNLREGLGLFFNQCKGTDGHGVHLTPQNIPFVNYVYSVFVEKATVSALAPLDLDKMAPPKTEAGSIRYGIEWKRVARLAGFSQVSDMAAALQSQGAEGYPVDPLLFLALVKQESNFNHAAVSPLGAVGLTQIMPKTAMDMGLEEIFMPAYYEEAMAMMARERSLRNEAVSLLLEMDEQNRFQKADRARQLTQEALECADRRSELFSRYRRALLKDGTDSRLKPRVALQCGLNYLANMLKANEGDISLALAAYSAGAGRVKQYGGIPPYAETISFRNSVLGYYRTYLNHAKGARHVSWGNRPVQGITPKDAR
jgi:soluble lytic murein transglycosylase-like protein